MGNCIKIQSSKVCDDHDDDFFDDFYGKSEMRQLISHWRQSDGELEGEAAAMVASASKEVKIRMSKKQLEELLRVVDAQGLSVEETVKRLASFVQCEMRRPSQWKPALQSIPEVD